MAAFCFLGPISIMILRVAPSSDGGSASPRTEKLWSLVGLLEGLIALTAAVDSRKAAELFFKIKVSFVLLFFAR